MRGGASLPDYSPTQTVPIEILYVAIILSAEDQCPIGHMQYSDIALYRAISLYTACDRGPNILSSSYVATCSFYIMQMIYISIELLLALQTVCIMLQEDVNTLPCWVLLNKLMLNAAKCS